MVYNKDIDQEQHKMLRRAKEMKYLVQAILFDGDSERVINSTKTDEPEKVLQVFMLLHKSSHNYKYFTMELDSQKTTEHKNIY